MISEIQDILQSVIRTQNSVFSEKKRNIGEKAKESKDISLSSAKRIKQVSRDMR
jgi:hypothetical protein